MLDQLDHELAPIDRALQVFARRQPGCRTLIAQRSRICASRRCTPC
jgi:hypothetical protein